MKSAIRQQMRDRLAAMNPVEAARKSAAACDALTDLPEFAEAAVVMAYLCIRGELNVDRIIRRAWEAGKTLLVPRLETLAEPMIAVACSSLQVGLAVGKSGIREPVGGDEFPAQRIDLIVTPGLAFDRSGGRLGRGGGCYDRFLARPGVSALRCGVAFDEQIVERLPLGPHDQAVDLLVTDKQVLVFRRPGEATSPSGGPQRQE